MGLLDEAIREHLELKRRRGADPAEIAREEREALSPPTRTSETQAARAREEPGEEADAALDEPATAFEPRVVSNEQEAPEEPETPLRAVEEPPDQAPPMRVSEEDLLSRPPEPAPPEPPPPAAPKDLPLAADEPLGPDEVPAPTEEPLAPEDLPVPADEPLAPEDLPSAAEEPLVPGPAPADLDRERAPALDSEPDTEDFALEEDELFADDHLDEPELDEFLEPELEEEVPEAPLQPDSPAGPPLDQPTQQYALEDIEDLSGHRPPSGAPGPETGDEEGLGGEDVLEETPDFLEETPEHDRLWFEQKPPRDFDF